jgi:GNAT superfamily N-acetyltransferase
MVIHKLTLAELPEALSLVWDTFQDFEAPDYSPEGVSKFKESIDDIEFISALAIYGAFVDNTLAGVIATRNNGTHIALFFVQRDFHRQGIGRALFNTIVESCPAIKITVNSSPYAVPVYEKLGFVRTDAEQMTDGIRFTPMEYVMK